MGKWLNGARVRKRGNRGKGHYHCLYAGYRPAALSALTGDGTF